MLGFCDAEHEETAPGAANLVISRLACSLVGQAQAIRIMPGTLAHQAYGQEEAVEQFRCSYGLDPAYQDRIRRGGLSISGVDRGGQVRIVELPRHPFFLATLFLPQLSSGPGRPHPLIVAYVKAARLFSEGQKESRRLR